MRLKLKKLYVLFITTFLLGLCINVPDINAYDFSDEGYWIRVCSGYITDQATYNACVEFQKYAQNKANDYQSSANDMQSKIDAAQGDISKLADISKGLQKDIDVKQEDINALQSGIDIAQGSIVKAETDIKKKKKNIKKRKQLIAKQMVDMQSDINTNQFIDFIMGATDLVDMVQRSSGIHSITKNQKKQIDTLNKEKKELNLAKKEQTRIQEQLRIQQDVIESTKSELEILKEDNDKYQDLLEAEVSRLLAEKNAANSAANTLANMQPPKINIGGDGNADVGDINSNGLMAPIANSFITRGILYDHRGIDWAANWGTAIIAPADCYVVFATNVFTNDSGNNFGCQDGLSAGAPRGGGNSVRIIFSLNGKTFAMNFHHMTTNMPAINYNGASQVVKQGTVLGHVGSSGNSTGPHAHVEMFELFGTVQQEVARWYAKGDWQSSAEWGPITPAYGPYGNRIDPQRYFN